MVRDRDLEHEASAVRCMAKIRLGKAIKEMQTHGELFKRGGDRKSNSHAVSLKKTLKAHEIDWRESAIYQKLAEKTPKQQEEIIEKIRLGTMSVNTVIRAQMLDDSRKRKCIEANRKATMKPDDPEFCVIYPDPAWDYGGDQFPNHPEASPSNHYRTAGEDTTAAEGGGKKKKEEHEGGGGRDREVPHRQEDQGPLACGPIYVGDGSADRDGAPNREGMGIRIQDHAGLGQAGSL